MVQVTNQASVAIVNCKNRIHADWCDQHPVLQIHMQLALLLIENNGILNERQIEAAFSKDMTKRYEELFKQLKTLKSDALGTGQYFRSKMPFHKLQDWRETY